MHSLAQGGASAQGGTAPSQLVTWQAAAERGLGTVVSVCILIGANDIAGGDTTAVCIADIQALVNDVNTNNPAATIYLMQLVPTLGHYTTLVLQQRWRDINDAIAGGGGTPIVNADVIVTSHVATMGDASNNLRFRGDGSDYLHEDNRGADLLAAALVGAGLT